MPTAEEILGDAQLVDPLVGTVIKELGLDQVDQEEACELFGVLTMRVAAAFTEDTEEFFVMVEQLKQGIDVAVYG